MQVHLSTGDPTAASLRLRSVTHRCPRHAAHPGGWQAEARPRRLPTWRPAGKAQSSAAGSLSAAACPTLQLQCTYKESCRSRQLRIDQHIAHVLRTRASFLLQVVVPSQASQPTAALSHGVSWD